MAHKKGGGSTRNGRDSQAKRLGVKVTSKDLADTPTRPTSDPEPPSAPTERPHRTPKRT